MPNYAIAKPIRAMNDYDANMSEEDRKRSQKDQEAWWERERKTAYCMMSSSPMQTKVNSEKW